MEVRVGPPPDSETVDRLEREAGFLRGPGEVSRRFRLDPRGFFQARDSSGKVVGTCATITYPDGGLAWIGGMYVIPPLRRRGVARTLLRACVAYARGRGCSVAGLDASDMGRPLYLAEGFTPVTTTTRWARPGGAPARPPPGRAPYAVYPVSSAELRDVTAYDRPRFGASRAAWLAEVMAENPGRAFAAYDRDDGRFVGYVLGQEAFIGPIVADHAAAAAWLLLAVEQAGAPAVVHILDNHADARGTLTAAGYAPTDATEFRMVQGGALPGRPATQYACGGWALG